MAPEDSDALSSPSILLLHCSSNSLLESAQSRMLCGALTVRLAQEAPLLADVPASFAQHLHYHTLSTAFLIVKRSLGEETLEFLKLLFPIH